ncbi:MAG: glycosyltransferase, partial [Parachlamydiaceae bacterium]
DALPKDQYFLHHLIAPLIEGKAALSYARQLPYPKAGFFEAFHREYNYPEQSQLRSLEDVNIYGAYTFFCSNSSAAYVSSELDAIGGFPDVLLGEDTYACATLLRKGKKIAYCADANVYHSHNYTLKEEFKRSFDTGYARSKLDTLIGGRKEDEKRGQAYAKALLSKLRVKPWLYPYTVILLTAKWLGYRLGYNGRSLPNKFKIKLSSTPYYFYN